MGGVNLEVRSTNKADTYRRFVEAAEENPLPDIYPDPKYKKLCKSLMRQDPDTGEWVLRFRFQT